MTHEEGGRRAVYEVGYLLVPNLSDEEALARAGDLKALLAQSGAEIISEEGPLLRPLSYDMAKAIGNQKKLFDQGYFGWIKFELDRDAALSVERSVASREDVIRALLVETVRENTLQRKSVQKAERPASGEKKLTEDEIDRTIEELVKE